jgi:tetratricopeptide (TPR) repeat protein
MGQPEKALAALLSHRFHAWEGGEGMAAGQFAAAHLLLGRAALVRGEAREALGYFEKAQDTPASLGVGRTSTQMDGQVWFHIAAACDALGQADAAKEHYEKVLKAEARETLTQPFTQLTYYAAMAMRKLGDEAGSLAMLHALLAHATERLTAEEEITFLTSRPMAVVFNEDPSVVRAAQYEPLVALAKAGLEGRVILAGGK